MYHSLHLYVSKHNIYIKFIPFQRHPTDKAYFIAKEILMTERTYKKDLEVINLVGHQIWSNNLPGIYYWSRIKTDQWKRYYIRWRILRLSIWPLNLPTVSLWTSLNLPIKISSKLDGIPVKICGKVKWQKVGFKFKKLRQGETVPLWDEPLPRARPDFPQRNTLFSFKMKLNIWELLKFPLFHPCHHVSSIFISTNTLSGSGTRSPRRTQCPRRPSPSYFFKNHFHFFI